MYWSYNDVCFYLFIYVSDITVWGSETAAIFFNSKFFDRKMNLVGALERKIPNSFHKRR